MPRRTRHEFLWVFQAVTHKLTLPFSFGDGVELRTLDTRGLMRQTEFTKELNEEQKTAWAMAHNFVCISAADEYDHMDEGEDDQRLRSRVDTALVALRFAYPAPFQNVTSIRCERWKMHRDVGSGEFVWCQKEADDHGYEAWTAGYNGFNEYDFIFHPSRSILTPDRLEVARKLYIAWSDPARWKETNKHLRIATQHLDQALQDRQVFARYMGCFVALESLLSTYKEFCDNGPGPLFYKIILPRLRKLLRGKVPPAFYATERMRTLYRWRGILAHRGTGSFIRKENIVDAALRPNERAKNRVMGQLEILAREAVMAGWLDYARYEALGVR